MSRVAASLLSYAARVAAAPLDRKTIGSAGVDSVSRCVTQAHDDEGAGAAARRGAEGQDPAYQDPRVARRRDQDEGPPAPDPRLQPRPERARTGLQPRRG